MADRLDHHGGLEPGLACLIRRVRVVRAHGSRQVELLGQLVDTDDADVVVRQRGEHRRHADAAEADDDHGLAWLRTARVDHRATAGQHRAPEERRDLRWHVGGHGHHRPPVDDRVGGEARDAKVVVNRIAVAREASPAGHQRARRVGGAAGLAGGEPVRRAGVAVAAPGEKRHHQPLSDRDVGDAGADFLDDTGRLVAEQHRHRPDPAAVDDRQVGVAHARGLDAHEKLAGAGGRQVEVLHRKRPGFGIRAGEADLFEYGAADPHGYQTAVTARLLP